jgi:hypothetical protein
MEHLGQSKTLLSERIAQQKLAEQVEAERWTRERIGYEKGVLAAVGVTATRPVWIVGPMAAFRVLADGTEPSVNVGAI